MVIHLTQSLVDSYKLPENSPKQVELVDDGRSGLYLLVTKSGSKSFFIRYRGPESNVTAHKKLGLASDISLSQAKDLVKKIRADISQGNDPKIDEKNRRHSINFRDFFINHYMERHANLRKKSALFDLRVFKIRLEPVLGDKRLLDISRKDLFALQDSLMQQGLADGTINRAVQLLKGNLNRASDWEFLQDSPGTRFPMLPEIAQQGRFLDDDELARLISVLRSDRNRSVCQILLWLISTGARLNEALTAKICDVDETRKAWTIQSEQAKNKRSRIVPLNEIALKVLKERTSDSEWLWPNQKTGKPFTTITRVWYRLRKEAGITNCRIHDLRHTLDHTLHRLMYLVQS